MKLQRYGPTSTIARLSGEAEMKELSWGDYYFAAEADAEHEADRDAAFLRGLRHAAEELTPSSRGIAFDYGWNARQDAIMAKVRLAVLRSGG